MSRMGIAKGLLTGIVIIGALGYAGTHSEGMGAPAAPVTPASEVVAPPPTPDVCAAARHGQHIDDCHSYTERTVE
jgi:hypothetical protein